MTPPPRLGVGPRVADFLRQVYPRNRAKMIAREFGVSDSTAERWLSDHAPTTNHLEQMYAKWGEAFVRAIFPEAFANNDSRLKDLSDTLKLVAVAGGMSGAAIAAEVAAGVTSPATGMARWWSFTSRFLGRASSETEPLVPSDPHRIQLLEDLLTTVPEEKTARPA